MKPPENEQSKDPATFREVIAAEWACLKERRAANGFHDAGNGDADGQTDIAGIALSGGGIRSATFCLGVLQALARQGVLRGFDYLSTVSGGGFTGSWWSAWIVRHALAGSADDIPQVGTPSRALDSAAGYQEPFPLHHVRLYGNYLTPRKGVLSADTWGAATVIVRNLFFTWSALLPLLIAAAFVAELAFGTLAKAPSSAALVCPPQEAAQSQGSAAQGSTTSPAATLNERICATMARDLVSCGGKLSR